MSSAQGSVANTSVNRNSVVGNPSSCTKAFITSGLDSKGNHRFSAPG
eukprot:CAMPEP_0118974232 /NCGR_PEP_ID=MMETSP1173-20130426/11144_1 /TAXON_ID=1034831 /ORGANISM="Rhizochromulina marina cf, Strain CCMP1243" /LENGTH=46 /DNA_ID= /DNA_START= /DNA_END= /DNA_ORIENTATION=